MNFSKSLFSSKKSKTILVICLIALSLTALEFTTRNVQADHATVSQDLTTTGTHVVSFRDITNTANTTSAVSLDNSTYSIGGTATITVVDNDANVDLLNADVVLSTANSTTSGAASATAVLTETGPNTASFSGTIVLSSSPTSGNILQVNGGDNVTALYTGEKRFVGRATVEVTLASGVGTVDISDDIITSSAEVPCPVILFTHPITVDLTGDYSGDIKVTLSYANTLDENGLVQGNSAGSIRMMYRETAVNSDGNPAIFQELTPDAGPPFFGADTSLHNFAPIFTVTNIDQPPQRSGQYALGIDAGCIGGGGGGLVRAGLVVNALAGISAALGGAAFATGGGGGAGPPGPTITLGAIALYDSSSEIISMPQDVRDTALNHDPYTPLELITDIYEDFDLPLSINGNGFALGGYENTLETQTIEPGEPTEFVLVYYTTYELAHSSLNFNLGPTRTIAGSDTQVLLYKDKPPEIVDPNGNIASATGSINNEGELKRVATFSITFSETAELPNPDMVIRSWNDQLNSGDTIVYDAIKVASPQIVEIADEDIPEPEIQTLKSQYVPIWIKNNAAWWSQELIEDSDFVAGIEYLIQQEIILISDSGDVTNTSNEIPSWIKNNAGWWSEDLITEKEFIDGLQWLVSNGIIQVTET